MIFRDLCRRTFVRFFAKDEGHSAGWRCLASLPTFTSPTIWYSRCSPRTAFSAAGSSWRGSESSFRDLPARICWLGYGERAEFGLAMNDLVKKGKIKAPIVIGRDHLDCGSVASPFRETEAMKDGSDAVADWPLLNALLNTAAARRGFRFTTAAAWASAIRCMPAKSPSRTAPTMMAKRIERVLTTDPGMGVVRHVDAGYDEAKEFAQAKGIKVPKV